MMDLRWWVEYGPEGDTLTYTSRHPMEPWEAELGGEGGDDIAASGIPEAYQIRADEIVHLTLRFEEDEWPEVREWLRWSRNSGQPFQFRLMADEAGTEYEVYLHSPRWSEGNVRPTRDAQFPGLYRIDVSLRTENGQLINTLWTDHWDDA
jgi:hypothetical protein